MKKLVYLVVPVLVLSMVGCASTRSGKPRKTDLKGRIEVLETRVEELEQRQTGGVMMEEQVSFTGITTKSSPAKGSSVLSGVEMSKKDIQAALSSAGYYSGNIDGILGPKTKQAIMDFQAAKGLKVDGVVGPQTEKALKKHLNK